MTVLVITHTRLSVKLAQWLQVAAGTAVADGY